MNKKQKKGRYVTHICDHCGASVKNDLIRHKAEKHNDEFSQRLLRELEQLEDEK